MGAEAPVEPVLTELNEKELQEMVEKRLDRLEPELTFIARSFPTDIGFIDTLALDRERRPVVIEYKVKEDDSAILQALAYANWIDKNPDSVQKYIQEKVPDLSISSLGDVRIILVAPRFSPRLKQALQMVEPDIKLVKYLAFEHSSIGKWLYFEEEEDIRKEKPPPEVYSIDDHFVGKYAAMRPIFDRLMEEAKKLGNDVNIEAKKNYIAFRRSYHFAVIYVYTTKLKVGLAVDAPASDPRAYDASKWGNPRIRYGITLKSENDIDNIFLEGLKAAYDAS